MDQGQQARILVVDDFSEWRSKIRDILQVRSDWKIVSEAHDGAAAVQKATELHPDIILLDLGLPKLNGIEAARIIRERSPESRIIFLSENTDQELISAALAIGRTRYVPKTNAATELVDAIENALRDL